jgi:hypothetical protein
MIRTATYDTATHKIVPKELGTNVDVSHAMSFAIDCDLGTVEIYRRTIAAAPEYKETE